MSAPLVVNTKNGVCWTRRTVTSGGIALYAPERVRTCPEFVMATLSELAEQGILGSADVLPMPVGPHPQPRTMLDRARDALKARMAKDDLRLVLENVIGYASWLESERHSTNESLDDAVRALREAQARLAEYERPADEDPIAYTLTDKAADTHPPALPWARLMDAEDLAEFLAEVEHAIATPGATPTEALAAVETACGTWRLIAEAQHAHNTAPGPNDEELRSCCAGPVCTCTPSSPQDDEHIPTGGDR